MKPDELKGQSDEQLNLTLKDTEKHLFQLRFQSATDRLETPSEIAKAKKDIARIRTEQRKRQLDKLPSISDDQLLKSFLELEAKFEGPGKRRAKRSAGRLLLLKVARLDQKLKTTAPAKGK